MIKRLIKGHWSRQTITFCYLHFSWAPSQTSSTDETYVYRARLSRDMWMNYNLHYFWQICVLLLNSIVIWTLKEYNSFEFVNRDNKTVSYVHLLFDVLNTLEKSEKFDKKQKNFYNSKFFLFSLLWANFYTKCI